MNRLAAVSLLLIGLVFPLQAMAHGGHVHKVMGTVTAIDTDHIEIESMDGESVSARLSDDTKYFKGDVPGTADDLKVGIRAVLFLAEEDGSKTVQEVRLPPDKDSKAGS